MSILTAKVSENKGYMLFLTGFSGSGKSTLAKALETPLNCKIIDGDVLRKTFQNDLPHGAAGRAENINRLITLAKRHLNSGQSICSAFVSPDKTLRERVRVAVEEAGALFFEIYVYATLETCQARDTKGLYARAKNGEDIHLAGLTEPYDAPEKPDVVCDTNCSTPSENVSQIIDFLNTKLSDQSA